MSDPKPSPLTPIQFDPIEARIMGCLMEKQRTTPDQYPLTLNALANACNQKSSRHPVMQLTTGEVGHAANGLRDRGLVHVSFSGRTERYDHKMVGTFHFSREQQAVLTVLLLRGPQTLGELRTNSARLADFPDLESVHRAVAALIDHVPSLAMELPRTPGRREERYAHLLCGTPELEEPPAPAARGQASAAGAGMGAARESRIAALEAEVARLRVQVDQLWELAGLEPPEDP